MKPFVYIASPYTKGDSCINAWVQIQMFNELMDDGIVWPYIPLVSHFLHTTHPRKYQDWIDYDLDIINKMDALFRIDADCEHMNYHVSESSGADGEELKASDIKLPVFYKKDDLYCWVRGDWAICQSSD